VTAIGVEASEPGYRRLDKSTSVDTFMSVDMRSASMLRLFKRAKGLAVEFCERCSRVCDAACRGEALRERALLQAWRYGARI
jgi:hypothetical protein